MRKTCIYCSKEFNARRSDTKFCSSTCLTKSFMSENHKLQKMDNDKILETTRKINEIRIEYANKEISSDLLRSIFRENKIPYYISLYNILADLNLIKRLNSYKYHTPNVFIFGDTPIHHSQIKKAMELAYEHHFKKYSHNNIEGNSSDNIPVKITEQPKQQTIKFVENTSKLTINSTNFPILKELFVKNVSPATINAILGKL